MSARGRGQRHKVVSGPAEGQWLGPGPVPKCTCVPLLY